MSFRQRAPSWQGRLHGAALLSLCLWGCSGAIGSQPAEQNKGREGSSPRGADGVASGPGAATGGAAIVVPSVSVDGTAGSAVAGAATDGDDREPLAELAEGAAWQPLPPAALVRKVKGTLTGLPPTAEDVAAVTADPQAMADLIAAWQQTPEYEARMVDFFTMAFQQGDVTAAMVANVTPYEQGMLDDRVIQAMRESFGRTAMQLVREGQPFTSVLTTDRFMLTPALMVAMAWLDERQSGDGGGVQDALHDKLGPDARYIMQGEREIPLSDSGDDNHPDYLTFYAPQVAAQEGDCAQPVEVNLQERITLYTHTMGETMMMFFMGDRVQRGFCVYQGRGILKPSDFNEWRMMRIRKPGPGEQRTFLYEIPRFRHGDELLFVKPRVGFYTTPAFLYAWQTNASNQARVTANQTLITAVGRSFDGSFIAEPVRDEAIDRGHAEPGTECFGCHVAMDPMRQFFRNTYTFNYGLQQDEQQRALPGVYVFDGESAVGEEIADLGRHLAQNRWFGIGWVHKLCIWANSAVCDPSGDVRRLPADPEFERLVAGFEAHQFDWNWLVRELFSSPLVTLAEPTKSFASSAPVTAVAKRAQLCRQWDLRLGLNDVCGLGALPSTGTGQIIRTVATILPADAYSRGQVMPSLANEPTLFFYSGLEAVCMDLSLRVVDSGDGSLFSSTTPEATIRKLVHGVMGLPAPEDQEAVAVLSDHYRDALAEGGDATVAMRSAFTLACLSPSAVGVGL